MKPISRRKLITSGLAATAGVAGLTAAARVAQHYGLIPPDHGGIYGPGQTLTYAAQRLLTMHSLAREFPAEHDFQERPLPTKCRRPRSLQAPPGEAGSQTGGFRWTAWSRGQHRFHCLT